MSDPKHMSSVGGGEECTVTEQQLLPPPPVPRTKMGCSWLFSLRTVAAGFSLILAVLFFHPSLHSFLVGSTDPNNPFLYVRNFHVWTRRHPQKAQDLSMGSRSALAATHFQSKQTYIIIHGFLGSSTDGWILSLKDALLNREDCNVISVNWSAGSTTAEYFLIQPRVRTVGAEVGQFLSFLEDAAGLYTYQVHVIGHSLGAHAAGFVGKTLNGTLPRITGLDPAGLSFHQADSADRLHHSDAVFVDVIHTHGCYTFLKMWEDCFGIDENLGDADFWPNGGERQPACEDGGDGATSVKDGSSCDHGMAYVLYIESIKYMPSSTHFLARQCPSWKHYNNRSCPCGHPVQYMGFNADPRAHGVFYLNTSRTAPYGLLDSDCSAGAFSLVQIIGLMMLSILLVLLLLLVGLVLIQQYFGLPILARVRARLYMEDLVWHGLGKSPSTHILNSDKAVDT
ncbi:pancreatic triacylglycerol lipase-like isoform X2 [Scylla paramamosain]|uniref:pancreatic triacylglycerol lipase-like isoform X2 n=1 Tax=Scylla paramamosain TaxID=85552 RepID=UPI0030829A30